MKFLCTIALIALIAYAPSVSRAYSFGDSALKCFEMATACEKGKQCTDEASPKQVKCLEAMGFSKSGCTFKRGFLSCDAGFVKKNFTNVNGCQVYLIGDYSEKYIDAFIVPEPKNPTGCRFGPYLVEDNPYQRVKVIDAKKAKSGWSLEIPKMSVGFESVLSPNLIKIHSASTTPRAEYTAPPWIHLINGNDESPSYSCEATLNNLKLVTMSATPELSKNRTKIFGYDDVDEPVGKKHFGGDGGLYTPVASQFSNLKEFKLCGRSVPADTKMRYGSFNGYACTATTPGAVPLLLPASLFPDAKGVPKDLGESDLVYCEPNALKASNIATLLKESNGGKKPVVIPKLDWQECECEYANPEEKSRR